MAIIKHSSTHNLASALRYCEHDKNVVRSAVGCEPDTECALVQMRSMSAYWKNKGGVEGEVFIQSFSGQEVDPQEANEIGRKLAEKLAPGHQCMVYTHSDRENIHNHIIFNAVNQETGKKFRNGFSSYKARAISDELCRIHGLSIVREKAGERYSQAEAGIRSKGGSPWKDKMRDIIRESIENSTCEEEFKKEMEKRGVFVNERVRKKDGERSWTYQIDGKKCRSAKLGFDFERESVCRAITDRNSIKREGYHKEEWELFDSLDSVKNNYPDSVNMNTYIEFGFKHKRSLENIKGVALRYNQKKDIIGLANKQMYLAKNGVIHPLRIGTKAMKVVGKVLGVVPVIGKPLKIVLEMPDKVAGNMSVNVGKAAESSFLQKLATSGKIVKSGMELGKTSKPKNTDRKGKNKVEGADAMGNQQQGNNKGSAIENVLQHFLENEKRFDAGNTQDIVAAGLRLRSLLDEADAEEWSMLSEAEKMDRRNNVKVLERY